jgi:hypothetical protein
MEKNIEKLYNLLYFSLFSIYYNSVNLILYLIIYYNPLILLNVIYNVIFLLITIPLFLISIIMYLNFKHNSSIIILLLIYIITNFLLFFKYPFIVYNILFSIISFSYFLIYYLIYKDLYKILSFFKILKFYKIFNILNLINFIINLLEIFLRIFAINLFRIFIISSSEYTIFHLIYSTILFVILYKNIYILIKKYSTYYAS